MNATRATTKDEEGATSNAPQFLPWQEETARNWLGNRDRFAHAWLIHGLAGIGKLDFAVAAAASLLCESPFTLR